MQEIMGKNECLKKPTKTGSSFRHLFGKRLVGVYRFYPDSISVPDYVPITQRITFFYGTSN